VALPRIPGTLQCSHEQLLRLFAFAAADGSLRARWIGRWMALRRRNGPLGLSLWLRAGVQKSLAEWTVALMVRAQLGCASTRKLGWVAFLQFRKGRWNCLT
jgi:hypothetical protein